MEKWLNSREKKSILYHEKLISIQIDEGIVWMGWSLGESVAENSINSNSNLAQIWIENAKYINKWLENRIESTDQTNNLRMQKKIP